MGLEAKNCKATIQCQEFVGNLHVDAKSLVFTCKGLRWELAAGQGTRALVVEEGVFRVSRGSKSAEFFVGSKAEDWVHKVLHPPTRATKLGLKPADRYWLSGDFEDSFRSEVEDAGLTAAKSIRSCTIAFVLLKSTEQLKSFDKVAASATTGTHLWAVWPKGVTTIRQSEVIARARALGMGPGKGIAFDEIHSAMRFTIKN